MKTRLTHGDILCVDGDRKCTFSTAIATSTLTVTRIIVKTWTENGANTNETRGQTRNVGRQASMNVYTRSRMMGMDLSEYLININQSMATDAHEIFSQ